MAATILVRDETATGQALHEFVMQLPAEQTTVRELIRSRVYQEVKDYDTSSSSHFRGLVRPTEAEETLNGYRLNKPRAIDWKQQFERAISAFENNEVLILIDEQQVSSLDEELPLHPKSVCTFLRLMPLVGG